MAVPGSRFLADLTTPFSGAHWVISGRRWGVLEGSILADLGDLTILLSGPHRAIQGAR